MEKPNLNTGKPWSADEQADLIIALERGEPVAEIATFLCRTEGEVLDRIASVEREVAAEAVDAPRWKDASPCYVRYGYLPTGGRSHNSSTGDLEAGTSVFRGEKLPTGEVRARPASNHELRTFFDVRGAAFHCHRH